MPEWRCTNCGARHESSDPPCPECGHEQFANVADGTTSTDDESSTTMTVWRCPECGREHPKNAPQCRRCGSLRLEEAEKTTEEMMPTRDGRIPSWTIYAVGIVAFLAVAAAFASGFSGIAPAPERPASDQPIPDAPGSAEWADGLNLSAVERGAVEEINDHRETSSDRLSWREGLHRGAAFTTQFRVTKGDWPGREALANAPTAEACERTDVTPAALGIGNRYTIDYYSEESTMAADVARRWIQYESGQLTDPEYDAIGVDVHVGPDGVIFAAVALC